MDASKENRNTFISRGMSSLICQTSEPGTCFLNQIKNKQAPLPFTLVQMFLLICLLLSFTVFAAPVRTKKKRGITVPNKYLTSRQALSSWPVCTCHNLRSAAPLQQPMTQLSRGVTDSSNCSECYWHQQSIKGNTDLHICISAFKQRKLEFQLPSLQMYICNAVQNGC